MKPFNSAMFIPLMPCAWYTLTAFYIYTNQAVGSDWLAWPIILNGYTTCKRKRTLKTPCSGIIKKMQRVRSVGIYVYSIYMIVKLRYVIVTSNHKVKR